VKGLTPLNELRKANSTVGLFAFGNKSGLRRKERKGIRPNHMNEETKTVCDHSKTPSTERIAFQEFVGNNFKDFKKNMQKLSKAGAYLAHQTMIDASKLYHIVEVEKKGTTEKRKCYAPCYTLKRLQKALLETLEKKIQPHEAAHGFRKGHSNATAAKTIAKSIKTGKYTLINQDLKSAFPSMKARQVRKIFRELGFSTWQVHIAAKISCYQGELATGSPLSPMLLNIELIQLDERLSAVARRVSGSYVRYADDLSMCINTHKRKIINRVKKEIRKAITKAKFTPHPNKHKTTRIGKDSDKAETVGISIASQSTRPPQRQRRALFHIAKALGITTTSADTNLARKVKEQAEKADPDDPLKWKGLGYYAYFLSV
jgi:hypothetical protein